MTGLAVTGVEATEAEDTAHELRRARVEAFLAESMDAGRLDAWILLTREGHLDPLSRDFGFHIGRGALIFVREKEGPAVRRSAVVSSLDLVPLRQSGLYESLVPVEKDQRFEDVLADTLKEIFKARPPKRIGVNMSDASGLADGLSASSWHLLRRALGPELQDRLVSAETTVLSYRSKKLPQEIALYRKATRITHEILHEAMTDGFLKPGMTTQTEMRDHVQSLARRRGFDELAWEENACPGVYSGLFKDLSHAAPERRTIDPGDILWLDFGIKYDGYATDMIRAAYVLKPGETEAPDWVRHMFDTARRANDAAGAALIPGRRGYEVDAAARRVVTDAGYPEFFHSTGHPVGFAVHGAGPSLGPKGPKYGSAVELPLEAGQIFAIEPSVMQPREDLGGAFILNIEEEVLVTPEGGEYLSPRQTELYLIASP